MSDVETVRTALFAWSPIDTGADEPLAALSRIEADIAQLLEDNAKMLEYGEDVGWIHAGDIEKNRVELARLRTEGTELRESLRQIRAIANHRLNTVLTMQMSDNDYAGFDHIAGIARRALLKTELTDAKVELARLGESYDVLVRSEDDLRDENARLRSVLEEITELHDVNADEGPSMARRVLKETQ